MLHSFNPHKFQNKYRIPSTRLRGYDYRNAGWYFVTICTKNREHLFGAIQGTMAVLSGFGKIVAHTWNALPTHYHHCRLDAFIVMPNHVHGIIEIVGRGPVETGLKPVSTSRTPAQPLSEIVRGFKTFSARQINTERQTPGWPVWQPRYHDRVIRDAGELERIRRYIRANPERWGWGRDRNRP